MSKYLIVLFLFCLFFDQTSHCQILNDEGLKTYWAAMNKLEKKDTLSPKSWEDLWHSPGFNKWMDTERSQKIFKKYFQLVYRPSYRDSLVNEIARSSKYRKKMFSHIIEAKQKRRKIKRFVKRLKSSNLVSEARRIVADYLPNDFELKNDSTEVKLMIFQSDAFAYEDVILMDALFAYNYGEGLEYLLAHELHHVYVSKYISKLRNVPVESEYSPLINSFNTLRLEGTADLIDKSDILERTNKSAYEKAYIKHYQESKNHLLKIDSLLQLIAADESLVEKYGKEIKRELPYNGHPTGLYIAHLIEKYKGRKEYITCLENPFKFLKMYNQIAAKHPAEFHVFSDKAMQYIDKLERDFILK